MELSDARWDGLEDIRLILVPLGSTEQHGLHLPYDTDTVIATAVARGVAERMSARSDAVGVRVAPAVAYGASGEHQAFAGTASIGRDALRHLLVELGRSLSCWTPRIAFVNGHGGNIEAVAAAVSLLRDEGRDVAWAPCAADGADAHAGRTETSLMLHLEPRRVLAQRAVAGPTAGIAELLPELRAHGVRAVSPSGVLGDPADASAEEGASILGEMIGRVLARLDAAVEQQGVAE